MAVPHLDRKTEGAGAAGKTASGATPPQARQALPPPRERGKTFIAEEVISVIARSAAEQIEGVYKIGESNLRSLFARFGRSHGIESEVGMSQAAVDIEIVVHFGYPIKEVAQQLREAVIDAVERMTGRQVIEVNVNVADVYVPRVEYRPRQSRVE